MNLYYELETLKGQMPENTYKTILGQIKAGDVKGAQTGIRRMKARMRRNKHGDK